MFGETVNSGSIPALEKLLAFTEARHRVLTENVANIDTPGYVTKELDPAKFQQTLRQAIDSSRAANHADVHLGATEQFHEDADGHLAVTPTTRTAENVLFHDGTNSSVERQMAMLAENAMMHQTATELLRGQFELMMKAIRGSAR